MTDAERQELLTAMIIAFDDARWKDGFPEIRKCLAAALSVAEPVIRGDERAQLRKALDRMRARGDAAGEATP